MLGITYISARFTIYWWRWCGLFLLTLCLLMAAASLDLSIGDLSGGGMLGRALLACSVAWLSPPGSFLLWLFIFLAGLQLAFNFSWISVGRWLKTSFLRFYAWCQSKRKVPHNLAHWQERVAILAERLKPLHEAFQKFAARFAARPVEAGKSEKSLPQAIRAPVMPEIMIEPKKSADPPKIVITPEITLVPSGAEPQLAAESAEPESGEEDWGGAEFELAEEEPAPVRKPKLAARPGGPLLLPGPELLNPPAPVQALSTQELEARGEALMACFSDFDIQGTLARITPGPVVTMFEVRPAPGIRVSRIANLSDDLSLALKAVAVRIQAPIPGSDTVGIEIPNENRETVNFRELVESPAFAKASGALTMILGKDIAGKPFMADLARMPHMLVAGATGAGKSVCLNSILISLLYRMPPERLRLLLVDPKRIEMAVYADLPHLVHPVVTEMEDATNALAWAVAEMESRFKIFMRLGVRNIGAYHEKLASFRGHAPESLADLAPMPYMVIVIDELADLMLTAAREVEGKIQRLAQLARAAGIHMILATQRPSVDVVTGLIKAQFPCRISFQVSSRHDSRTILDEMGAEHLLGRGDMLFKPPGSRLLRLHGPFLSDEEVQTVVEHWKAQQRPDYQVDFTRWASSAKVQETGAEAVSDPLYEEAREFVLTQPKPSISLLQRHLRIGYNRAARLMEQFRNDGILPPGQ